MAERIAALAAEGAEVQPRRKAAAKAAEDWQVARKVEGLRAEGEKVISKRAEGAQKLQAYVKETRAAAIVGDWADTDGMLCRLKADGTVLVPPSRGEAVAGANPHLSFTWIPDAGHSMHRDEFEAFVEAVGGWLGR